MPEVPIIPEGFGRAAEKLADTVRLVVDVAVGPDRIRARAQAQTDAALIATTGRIKEQELEARAVERLRKREARRQHNIESIAVKGMQALPPPNEVSEKPVSEDWTTRFFEECQDIGDEQMQQIWARILANEVARPGSFAPRTLNVVRDLTRDDANLFARLCGFVWWVPGANFVPIVHDLADPRVQGVLSFSQASHLASLGLIQFAGVAGCHIDKPLKEIVVTYCGQAHRLVGEGGTERNFGLGKFLFTAVGAELLRISQAPGSEEYRNVALEHWKKHGWNSVKEAPAPNPS
jgi:Protein of unknown function (DUF2806)